MTLEQLRHFQEDLAATRSWLVVIGEVVPASGLGSSLAVAMRARLSQRERDLLELLELVSAGLPDLAGGPAQRVPPGRTPPG